MGGNALAAMEDFDRARSMRAQTVSRSNWCGTE
jgi:hypothetical protein